MVSPAQEARKDAPSSSSDDWTLDELRGSVASIADDLKKVDLKGETLSIFGPWRGDDEAHIQVVLEYFREATGADVKYSSSENYEQQVVIDTQAGSPANISVR